MKKRRKKKNKIIQILEFVPIYIAIRSSIKIPNNVLRIISNLVGYMFYFFVPRRRSIALENLRKAYKDEKTAKEIRKIARQCFNSFLLIFIETQKLQLLYLKPDALNSLISRAKNLEYIFKKAKTIHNEAGGCIFVTPHIGSWESLPFVSAIFGIPLSVVVRPLDNEYLEKYLYANRIASGQVILAKSKALISLQETLRKGKSIGILPDQSDSRGISVSFFGRKARTTPIPAMLAVWYNKPIVVVAACKKTDDYHYEGFICEPIWPEKYSSEKAEVFRLTEAINKNMEHIIRKYPEQYLWFHNRWKTYLDDRSLIK